MKRVIALVLCLVFVVASFASCSSDDDKGAIINMYIGSEIRNLDPATAFTNADAVKILGLLYEGLMKINGKGELSKAMAESYSYDKEDNKLTFNLKKTSWSDAQQVSADEFVFAFQRILEPSFSSEAAVLLYPIKNARDVKAGDASIDSLGVTAPDTTVLEILLEEGADYNELLQNLASPALVPLREDKVKKPSTNEETGSVIRDDNGDIVYDTSWSTTSTMSVANGPFMLKSMEGVGSEYVLERNKYYLLEKDSNNLDKYVKPYRIVIHYEDYSVSGGAEKIVEDYKNKELFYTSSLPAEQLEEYKKSIKYTDMLSTNSYIFDTDNELFAIPEVRRALSMALDRAEIVALSNGVHTAATGLVPTAVFNTKKGTSFRDKQGDALSASADVDGAKKLLNGVTLPVDENGNTIKSFTITYRTFLSNDFDKLVAEYAKAQWEKLGFEVKLSPLGINRYATALSEGNYDVISIDYQTNVPSAIATLAPFALDFSGAAKDTVNNNFDPQPGITGYNSDAYNALIEDAYKLPAFSAERAAKLYEAEKLLMQDSPIIPLVFYRDYYISQELSDISTSIFGFKYFHETSLKNYEKYLPVDETQAVQ